MVAHSVARWIRDRSGRADIAALGEAEPDHRGWTAPHPSRAARGPGADEPLETLPPVPRPPFTYLDPYVRGLWSGSRWSFEELRISYSFPGAATDYADTPDYGEFTGTFRPFHAEQRAAAITILQSIEALTRITIAPAATPGGGDIRFGITDRMTAGYYPGPGRGGDVWFQEAPQLRMPVPGNLAYVTVMHEIMHAMGLKHPHEAPEMPANGDSLEYSVVSYRSYVGGPTNQGYSNEAVGFPQTLMLYDIAALQYFYGADFTHNGGDTVYRWNAQTGQMIVNGVEQALPAANRVFMTIWDGGGRDTYDLSNYSAGVRIDLRPGQWTVTSTAQLANLGGGENNGFARGNVANALLFESDRASLIEDAVGTAADDTIRGNQGANRLTGGGGNDVIVGGTGSDVLIGSAGADRFLFESVMDSSPYERRSDGRKLAPDRIEDFVSGLDRIDLSAVDAVRGTAENEAFSFIGAGAFSGRAGELRYEAGGGVLHVHADIDGDRIPDMHILVSTSAPSLSAADFIL